MPATGPTREYAANGGGDMSFPIRPGQRFRLSYIRAHFRRLTGTGTDVANLTIDLNSVRGDDFDVKLATFSSVGIAADVHFRVNDEESSQWEFGDGDELTFNWTNPDATEIRWGIVVGVIPWE